MPMKSAVRFDRLDCQCPRRQPTHFSAEATTPEYQRGRLARISARRIIPISDVAGDGLRREACARDEVEQVGDDRTGVRDADPSRRPPRSHGRKNRPVPPTYHPTQPPSSSLFSRVRLALTQGRNPVALMKGDERAA